ncbi:kif21a protein [Obelidium mucronatum]|nr:kif21a protein [Obelidium mucronatum]
MNKELEQQPVTVAIRVRPPNAVSAKNKESHQSTLHKVCLGTISKANAIVLSKEEPLSMSNAPLPSSNSTATARKTFTFDKIHASESSQEELYNSSCANLVNQFVDGFNVTIFAYGQTSSGKTYTMGSNNDLNTPDHEMGVIPRVVEQIMNLISMKERVDPNITFSIRCTFLEIYQEQVRDLLMPHNDSKEIAIREDRNGSITVSGVHEEPVTTAKDLFKCLEIGGIERTTGDTKMHMSSSRSHAIFTLILEQRLDTSKILGMKTDEEDLGFATPASSVCGSRLLRSSKLHLVDLAGSERVKRTGAEGVRLKESVKINSGLLALGNVISVLGEMHDATPASPATTIHVPYRDSKLTRLLQNSLGGNAKTLMLACVSPCEEDYEETLNTLKYADRARKIQNKPIINTIDHQAVKLASMQEKIDFLEAQIKKQDSNIRQHENHIQSDHKSESSQGQSGLNDTSFVDMENDKLIMYFVEELKNRTIRGTNAMKALQDSNNENLRLVERISDLEERYNVIVFVCICHRFKT